MESLHSTSTVAQQLSQVAIDSYERGVSVGYDRCMAQLQPTGESPPTHIARQRTNTVGREVVEPPPSLDNKTSKQHLNVDATTLHTDKMASLSNNEPPSNTLIAPAPSSNDVTSSLGVPADDLVAAVSALKLDRSLPLCTNWADQVEAEEKRNTEQTIRQRCGYKRTDNQSVTITSVVKDMAAPWKTMCYDNSYVPNNAETHKQLGITVLPSVAVPYVKKPNTVSPVHDHMITGMAVFTGLELSVAACEVKISAQLGTEQNKLYVHGRIDAVCTDKDGGLVVVENKTSGQLTKDEWFKDVMRRQYIQQVQLGALMVHLRMGKRPSGCLITAGPSESPAKPADALYRFMVEYNPKLWLCDINRYTKLFLRFTGGESADCKLKTGLVVANDYQSD